MVLYFNGVICQHHHILITDGKALAFLGCRFDIFGVLYSHVADIGLFGKDHFKRLASKAAFEYGTVSFVEGRFVDVECVRVDGTEYHVLSQTQRGIHENNITEACFGIKTEHDPACTDVAAYHLHNNRREIDFVVVKTMVIFVV